MEHAQIAKTLITEFSNAFVKDKRTNGEEFVHLKEGRPEWMQDLVHVCHCEMWVDDTRYEMIREVADTLAELEPDTWEDEGAQAAEGCVSVYNSDRTKWLASHLDRAGYCDEAQEQGYAADDTGIFDRIAAGMAMEYREIADAMVRYILDKAEEEFEDSDLDLDSEQQ